MSCVEPQKIAEYPSPPEYYQGSATRRQGYEPAEDPSRPSHLIIVCCHAIYVGDSFGDPTDESNWLLEPFQRSSGTVDESNHKPGEHITFLKHIQLGINCLDHNER